MMLRRFAPLLVLVALGALAWWIYRQGFDDAVETGADVEFNQMVVALQQDQNDLKVSTLSGTVTVNATVRGGIGDVLVGRIFVTQPAKIEYFLKMDQLTLERFMWDPQTRTLLVRAPQVEAAAPNIDESRRNVRYEGAMITRGMQTKLNSAVAYGSIRAANEQASDPKHIGVAQAAASKALMSNSQKLLNAVGVKDVTIQVVGNRDNLPSGEQWDVSRSIAEVLAERAKR